jgi:hypothetical protein
MPNPQTRLSCVQIISLYEDGPWVRVMVGQMLHCTKFAFSLEGGQKKFLILIFPIYQSPLPITEWPLPYAPINVMPDPREGVDTWGIGLISLLLGRGFDFIWHQGSSPGSGVLTFLLPVSYHFRKRGRHCGVFQENRKVNSWIISLYLRLFKMNSC